MGAKNAIICDLFRERYLQIPREVAHRFQKSRQIALEGSDSSTAVEEDPDVIQLVNLLEQDDWGHFTSVPAQFPAISMDYDHNGKISNCIIDIEGELDYSLSKVVEDLDLLGCQAAQLRFYKAFDLTFVKEILDYFKDTGIRYLEIILQNDPVTYAEEKLKSILPGQARLKNIYIFSAAKDEIVQMINETSGHLWRIIYSSEDFRSEQACGKITKGRFTINLASFTEAQNFNSCLNCKISIDKKGNIKNCPSFAHQYGKAKEISLTEVVKMEGYTKWFSYKKDDVATCKDCEFRYICTDCRAYTINSEAVLEKPSKCSYDPYTGTWN